jgi:hypothetical protein
MRPPRPRLAGWDAAASPSASRVTRLPRRIERATPVRALHLWGASLGSRYRRGSTRGAVHPVGSTRGLSASSGQYPWVIASKGQYPWVESIEWARIDAFWRKTVVSCPLDALHLRFVPCRSRLSADSRALEGSAYSMTGTRGLCPFDLVYPRILPLGASRDPFLGSARSGDRADPVHRNRAGVENGDMAITRSQPELGGRDRAQQQFRVSLRHDAVAPSLNQQHRHTDARQVESPRPNERAIVVDQSAAASATDRPGCSVDPP